MSALSGPQRTMSCDNSATINRTSTNSGSSIDETGLSNTIIAAGLNSSSSDHDNHEAGAWSSDYSNSEDEYTHVEDGVTPVSY